MTSTTLLAVDKVFVPGLDSEYTHVERNDAPQVAKIRQYVHQKGFLIPVVGPTKMGKTVLVTRTVPDAFYMAGDWIVEPKDFWIRLAAKLDIPTTQNGNRTDGDTSKWGFRAKLDLLLGSAESNFGGEHSKAIAKGWSSEIPADQAVTTAIRALHEVDQSAVIIIDDFHFMPPSVRAKVVASLKGLCANGATGVLITLPHHRNEAVTQIQDMIGRYKVAGIEGWSMHELEEIARLGFQRLNLVDPNGTFGKKLASESYGSPQLMQALCLSFVRDANQVSEEKQQPTQLVAPSSWTEFFEEQVDERAYEWLETLVFGPPVRGQARRVFALKDGRKLDGYQLIFAAIKAGGPALSTTVPHLKSLITQLLVNETSEEYARLNVVTKLKQLTKIASNTLSAQHEEDLETEDDELPAVAAAPDEATPNSKHQPLFEFSARVKGEINFLEPYLAYALKWKSDDLLN